MFRKKKKSKPTTTWGKIWYFIWEDDSILSWVVNIVLAFVLIKFIVYPGLGFLLATSHPIVAVVSGSMYHGLEPTADVYGICGNVVPDREHISYDEWWDYCGSFYTNKNITKEEFRSFVMHNGFSKGDIIILKGSAPEDIQVGDIIVFVTPQRPDPIIHRVVEKTRDTNKYLFTTKGDHNAGSGDFELKITENQIIGKAVVKLPLLGYVKILAVDFLRLFI